MFARVLPFLLALSCGVPADAQDAQDLRFHSVFLRVEMAAGQPNFKTLAVDSLGKNKLDLNTMQPLRVPATAYRVSRMGQRVEYRSGEGAAEWAFQFADRRVTIRSTYSEANPPKPLVLNFDPILCHATVLGLFNDDGAVRLPALLHFPDHGTFRIRATAPGLALGYDALRDSDNFVRVTFPAATPARRQIEYQLEVAAIYPGGPQVANDPRLDGFRRDFLNIFQINPRLRVLANHAASDPCAFTVYMYSAVAVKAPPLAEGLTALDLLRQTLDRYAGGMKAYGMAHYGDSRGLPYDFLDTYPSLVMAAGDYARTSHDKAWVERNYAVVKSWADKIIQFDRDGDGLMEYPLSGNSGSWTRLVSIRPSNWWDTIGFRSEELGRQDHPVRQGRRRPHGVSAQRQLGFLDEAGVDPAVELVGHHWFRAQRRLRERAGLPCVDRDAGNRADERANGRSRHVYRAGGQAERLVLRHFFQSGDGRAGWLEKRRRQTSRLLFPLRERRGGDVRSADSRARQPRLGQAADEDEGSGLHAVRPGLTGQSDSDPARGLRAPGEALGRAGAGGRVGRISDLRERRRDGLLRLVHAAGALRFGAKGRSGCHALPHAEGI